MLNALLGGYDESDQRAARLLRRSGYLQQRQSYCVVVAQSVDPGEMESAPRTQRIIDAVAKELAGRSLRMIAGVRDNLVTVVLSGTRRLSGWTAPQAKLAGQIENELLRLGPTVLVGISADQPSTSHIPRALNEARIAFEFASVTDRVVSLATGAEPPGRPRRCRVRPWGTGWCRFRTCQFVVCSCTLAATG